MLSIIGAILGFAGSTVPAIIEARKVKSEMQFKLEAMKLQVDLEKSLSETRLKEFREKQDYLVHDRLLTHDTSISNETGVIGFIRKSVRPVITYAFFAMFITVKLTLMNHGMDSGVPFVEVVQAMWDPETQGIFSAVIAFWFGNRAIEKRQYSMDAKS